MNDLVAFLKARLDEDEAWFRDPRSVDDPVGEDLRQQLLRTITAMRAILTQVVPQIVEMDQQIISEWGSSRDEPDEHLPLLKIMAAVYSDHPDYRDEWKP